MFLQIIQVETVENPKPEKVPVPVRGKQLGESVSSLKSKPRRVFHLHLRAQHAVVF